MNRRSRLGRSGMILSPSVGGFPLKYVEWTFLSISTHRDGQECPSYGTAHERSVPWNSMSPARKNITDYRCGRRRYLKVRTLSTPTDDLRELGISKELAFAAATPAGKMPALSGSGNLVSLAQEGIKGYSFPW